MEMQNKTALITGATSGIGFELAKLFARDKFNLVLVARTFEDLNRAALDLKAIGAPQTIVLPKDLSKPEAAADLYEDILRLGLTINVLVNDAGVGKRGLFAQVDFQKDLEIINLNVISVVHLTKLFLKDMLARNEGRILQVASIASYQPTPLLAVYAASKAFILSFTDALINEVKDTNVILTALIPGPTDTDFFAKADAEHTVAAHKTDDPAVVAKEGYDGLLKGEHHVTATALVQAQVAMSAALPNEAVSAMAKKYMEEDNTDKKQ